MNLGLIHSQYSLGLYTVKDTQVEKTFAFMRVMATPNTAVSQLACHHKHIL